MQHKAGKITDARNYHGVLTCQIVGTSVPGKPNRKSCIAVLNSIDYAWLAETQSEPEVAEDGKCVRFAETEPAISLNQIMGLSTIYYLRWSPSGFVNLPKPDQLAGCWRTANGFVLIHSSGMVRFITVTRGPATDDGGDWAWKQTAANQFTIDKLDATDANQLAYRQDYSLCRYDGAILELFCVSGFNLDPKGFPNVRYWKREPKYPKLWRDWT